MKSEDLLHAMENIKDEYILEADEKVPEIPGQKSLSPEKEKDSRKIFRIRPSHIIGAAAACLLLAGMYSIFSRPVMNDTASGAKQEAASDNGDTAEEAEYEDAADEETAGLNEEEGAAEAYDADVPNAAEYSVNAPAEDAETASAEPAQEGIPAEGGKAAETAGTANPYAECATMAEAAEAAGFYFYTDGVAEVRKSVRDKVIRAIRGEMIEVIYLDASGGEVMRIRKGRGPGDISGDLNNYTDEDTWMIEGSEVTLKGEKGLYAVAAWQQDDWSFAVCAEDSPLTFGEMEEVIKCMR